MADIDVNQSVEDVSQSVEDVNQLVEELQTPCFLVDVDKVKHNITGMLDCCKDLGLKLRLHMKTAKTVEVGEMATRGSKSCICVSTLSEAEFFADEGFDDIIYAMLISGSKLTRLKSLHEKLEAFHVLIDNSQHLDILDESNTTKEWSVYLAVDTGSEREGVLWNDPAAVELCKRIATSPKLTFRGLYSHEGSLSYHVQGSQVTEVANTTANRLLNLAKQLRDAGISCTEVSMGATPTASRPGELLRGITELHPGNFVFYDCQQQQIGSCSEMDIACQVMTRVIGQYPQRNELLVDAGWSAVSLDGKLTNGSYGNFKDYPKLRLTKMNQEYGFVSFDPEFHSVEDFPIGTVLYLFPYHSCATALLHHTYVVHQQNRVVGTWSPVSQW